MSSKVLEETTVVSLVEELDIILRLKPQHAVLINRHGIHEETNEVPYTSGADLKYPVLIYKARKLLGLSLEASEDGMFSMDGIEKAEWELALKLSLKNESEGQSLRDGVVVREDGGN